MLFRGLYHDPPPTPNFRKLPYLDPRAQYDLNKWIDCFVVAARACKKWEAIRGQWDYIDLHMYLLNTWALFKHHGVTHALTLGPQNFLKLHGAKKVLMVGLQPYLLLCLVN